MLVNLVKMVEVVTVNVDLLLHRPTTTTQYKIIF